MRVSFRRAAAFLGILAFGLAGCASSTTKASNSAGRLEPPEASSLKPVSQRKPAPDFTLKDANGKEWKLSELKGKVVLLDFWATWCPPCLIEIPWLIEFQKTYKDRGFTVLGVSLDEDGWEAVRPFAEKRQLNYPIVLGDAMVEQKYGGVESLPTTFVIDKEGRIASIHIGLTSKQEFQDEIRQLLDN